MKAKILIADADRNLSEVLKGMLRRLDHRVKTCDAIADALILIAQEQWDLIICDIKFWNQTSGDSNILKVAADKRIPFAVLVSYDLQSLGNEAVAAGAFAMLVKPCRADELNAVVDKALELKHLNNATQIGGGFDSHDAERHLGYFIGEHPLMQSLYGQIVKIAATDMTVLVRGESGTGKELVAKAIHEQSARAGRPFVAINCASLSEQLLESELFGHVKGAFTGAIRSKEGLFETASGGTLFLDEIGSVSNGMQQALLRVLEDHKVRPVGGTEYISVNTRVIAATNENLEERIDDGRFRLDLFHRLSVLPIEIPPLRERREDISLLAGSFLKRQGCKAAISSQTMRLLESFPWPGNVRQLENIMLRIAALLPEGTETITADLLPRELLESVPKEQPANQPLTDVALPETIIPLKAFLRQCERKYIRQVLELNNGDKEADAKALGISVATFYRKYEED